VINKLIEWCAHNKFIVIVFIGMGVLWGLYSIKNIRLDAIPDLSDTQVIIYCRWDRRRSGNLPDHLGTPGCTQGEGHPGFLRFWFFLCLYHL